MMLATLLARVRPGLDEREAGLHEDHEHGGEQHPDVVEVDLDWVDLGCLSDSGCCEAEHHGCRER